MSGNIEIKNEDIDTIEEIDEEKSFRKFEKIKHLGVEGNEEIFHTSELVVIQTKLDGGQFNFWKEEDGLHLGRHGDELSEKEWSNKRKNGQSSWKAVEPIEKAYEEHKAIINPDWRYFGESMQSHNIHYTKAPGFVGYDILDTTTGKFLPWRQARKEFIFLGLPFIHIYYEMSGNELVLKDLKKLYETSIYGTEEDEGIVLKCDTKENRYGRALRTKIVNPKFQEKRGLKKVKTQDNKDEIEIIQMYALDARIEKRIFDFQDLGREIDLSLMKELPNLITKDILVENIAEIYDNQKKIHFKTLRNYVGKRCIVVLKEYLESKILL